MLGIDVKGIMKAMSNNINKLDQMILLMKEISGKLDKLIDKIDKIK